MSYRQLLANLEALPEGKRQLAGGVYVFRVNGREVCGCVLGKGVSAIRKAVLAGKWKNDRGVMGQTASNALPESRLIGLTLDEMGAAQWFNDDSAVPRVASGLRIDNRARSRRKRYERVVEWLRAHVSEESEAPQAL